jgi:hypothetical protein
MATTTAPAKKPAWSPPGTNASDTVFLLGSGAVANAWVPVVAAVQEFYAHARVTNEHEANFVLAWWVYHQRIRALRVQKGNLSEEAQERNRQLEISDLGLRQTIAAYLRVASEQSFFRLRPQAVGVLNDQRWGDSRVFLTANWDRLLEMDMAYPAKSVVHIHGNVEKPSCLYLPTETSTELYRTEEANKHIGLLTGTAWQFIRDARQLCIYGLSLSPLDAELGVVLGTGLEPRDGPTFPVYVYNLRGKQLDEAVWRVHAATHPKARVEIHPMPLDWEPDLPVPESWDRRPT